MTLSLNHGRKEEHGWISACPLVDRAISDPLKDLRNFTELDAVEKTGPPAPQDRPQAPRDVPEDPALTQVLLPVRKRTLMDMSESMRLDLVVGLHPGVPAVAARDVLMDPWRPDWASRG